MSRRSFYPGSAEHALLVVSGMCLIVAGMAFVGGVSFLAAPAVVFAVLSALHAFERRPR